MILATREALPAVLPQGRRRPALPGWARLGHTQPSLILPGLILPSLTLLSLALSLTLVGLPHSAAWAQPAPRAAPAQAAPAPAAPAQAAPAQAASPVPRAAAAQGAAPGGRPVSGAPLVDESFSIRQDETLYQLEEATTLIAGSLNKIADKVGILAINSFQFGKDVSSDFRAKAEVIILEKLLNSTGSVKLVQCQECQKLETKVVNNVLHLRKGIPSAEARRELAKKLGVDGFIDIGMFQEHYQQTIYIKVVEAQTGAIILVDEVVGRRAGKRDAVTLSFGEVNFPITMGTQTVQHNALALGVNETVQLTGRFSFGVDLIFYTDNNASNPDPHITLNGGIMLAPTLGFDVVQLPASTSRLILYLGLAKLIDPQFNYADLVRAGLQMVVGDRMVVVIGANSFSKTQLAITNSDIAKQPLAAGAVVNGVGYEIRFGYRF